MGSEALAAGAHVGRFVIVQPLGEGGMGMVYEARDPELGRSVALKLLRGKSPVLAMRLLREAQVLAQLQHPNVVGVHALDLHEDQVFIAMELVAGETLDKHIARTKPDWRGIVALFVQAGRGLIAAHAKAIVHRDIKPSNMFVDESGRVRVGDFGLARQMAEGSADGDAEGGSEPLVDGASMTTVDDADASTETPVTDRPLTRAPLTHAGAVLGTPFFMAPEQLLGKPATPASDQFSFCVAMWNALFGEHPFAVVGDSVAESVKAGRRANRPARGRVPRWLMATLDRGLATDPERRWPSISALVDELESRPIRRRRITLALAGASIAAASAVAFTLVPSSTDPCPPPTARIAKVWNDPRNADLRAHIGTIDPQRGASRFEVATRAISSFLGTWRDAHVAACSATRVRGEQSDTLLDARMRCLQMRLDELDASIALVLGAKDPQALDGAIGGLVEITPLSICEDRSALAIEVAAPLPVGARATADALRKQLGELEVAVRGNQKADLHLQAAAVVAAARGLGHPPTLVAALLAEADVDIRTRHFVVAERSLREITQLAAKGHDSRAEAIAWTRLVSVVGSGNAKPTEGLALVPAASAAVIRAGDPVDLRISLMYAESEVLGRAAKQADEIVKLEQALAMLATNGAEDPKSPLASMNIDIWQELGTANGMSGNSAKADAALRKSQELSRVLYGPDNLDEAFAFGNLAISLLEQGKPEDALAMAREALRIYELRTGESVVTADAFSRVGVVLAYQEKWADASSAYDRALGIYKGQGSDGELGAVDVLVNRAWVLGKLGKIDQEIHDLDEVIAVYTKTDASSPSLAAAYLTRANVNVRQKRYPEAFADFERSIATYETHYGKDSMYLVAPIVDYAHALIVAGRPADAISHYERLLTSVKGGLQNPIVIGAKGWLAKALEDAHRDHARAVALARETLEASASDPAVAAEVKELEPFLKKLGGAK